MPTPRITNWSDASARPKQTYRRRERTKKRPWTRVVGVMAGAATLAATLGTGIGPGSVEPASAQQPTPLSGVTVSNVSHSIHADRLIDGVLGTTNAVSWENTNPWASTSYPMTAVFDLGASYDLDSLEYFVGNLTIGRERIVFEGSTEVSGNAFTPLVEVSSGHQWNQWHDVSATATSIRRVRVSFSDRYDRFNVSEVHFFGELSDDGTGGGGGTTSGDMPQPAPPGPGIVRSTGFGNFPRAHLTSSCVELHNRYWVQGPGAGINPNPSASENKAYHTWHPAITAHPDTHESCDFGHEHGTNPQHAPSEVFELSGGWPAFGYAADVANGHRHEDHVGHKVSVAHFRASIGNAAGPLDGADPGPIDGALYDAGFECDWLSKIHQGSYSLDAFANHLHEYFLTLRCLDGLNSQGMMDGQTVGTELSVKVMYTYGRPNEFNEMNCSGGATFPTSVLTGPEGQSVMQAHQLLPLGNNTPNNREFVCSNGVEWQTVEQVSQVDLWTQLIKINRPDGHSAVMLQPYYIVKNPARIIEGFDASTGPNQVIRTIDICYGQDGSSLDRPFCEGSPETKPGWKSSDSPFNGTFRAINFKSAPVTNAGGPARFCTTAFGFSASSGGNQAGDTCGPGQILQTVTPFDNNWNNSQYSYGGHGGNVQGSIWAKAPNGDYFASPLLPAAIQPAGGGAYDPSGLGFEFIVDNRWPDDDLDGVPDGAHIRGEN